jgi:signal transduction histidine kinase
MNGLLLKLPYRMEKRPVRILLLEDVPEEAILIERLLRREHLECSIKRVDTEQEFVLALQDFCPDVVLSDHALPQFNSIHALAIARKFDPELAFILVTGTVSEEFAVTCLKQGADDYVLKSNLSRLPSAIINALNQRQAEAQRKEAEEKLREQNEHLLLANQQLIKTNAELDNFVYSVSHNLRAPLSSVLGLINLGKVEERMRGGSFSLYYDKMEESIARLDDTLKEILDYSQNARTGIRCDRFDISQLYHNTLSNLLYMPGAASIAIDYQITGSPVVVSDAHRLGVIFNNLLSNAIKYSDPKKPVQRILCRVIHADTLTITFEDNGIGIPEAHQSRVFDMFYRATLQSSGAGLGLYIVKESVEKLNGTLTVHSREGEGTTFSIILPLSPLTTG